MEIRPHSPGRHTQADPRNRQRRLIPLALFLIFFLTPPLPGSNGEIPSAEFSLNGLETVVVDGIEVDLLATNLPHVSLSWSIENGEDYPEDRAVIFTLEQSDSADFSEARALYEGRDRSSFRGGLPEGDVFFRVRAADDTGNAGEWSRPLQVQVTYQSMRDAILLFAVGGIVVLATLILVVAGSRKDREEARREEAPS